jgi:hypothetical protein
VIELDQNKLVRARETELKPKANLEDLISMRNTPAYEVDTDFYLPLSIYSKPLNNAKSNHPEFFISGETLSKDEKHKHENPRLTSTRQTKARTTGNTKITKIKQRKFKQQNIKIDIKYGQVKFYHIIHLELQLCK